MRKHRVSPLIVTTIIFAAFTLGFFLGSSRSREAITVSVPVEITTLPPAETTLPETLPEETRAITFPININTAVKEELTALPGIGDILAERIVACREEHGAFPSVEALLMVEGIGEKKLEAILDLITIGG